MKRALGVLLGLLLTLAGLVLAAVGGFGIAAFGTEGRYEGSATTVTSDPASVALVADVVSASLALPMSERLGTPQLTAGSTDGQPLFIGLAGTPAVDEYLYGAPYDLLVQDGGAWRTIVVPGVGAAVAPPDQEGFWSRSSVGSTARIALDDVGDGSSLVIMHADASPAVSAALSLGFAGPRIFPVALGAVVVGVLLLLLGVPAMLRLGKRRAEPVSTHETVSLLDIAEPAGAGAAAPEQSAQAAPDAWFRPADPGSGETRPGDPRG